MIADYAFNSVDVKLLKALPEHGSVGTDALENKVIRLAADHISYPICYILNKCLTDGIFSSIWREAKIIPLPSDNRLTFTGQNSRPITILPALNKLMEKIVRSQTKEDFDCNGLNTRFQLIDRTIPLVLLSQK